MLRFRVLVDFCCIYIGLVFIKDRPVSSFLGASFSKFWVLRASVFVFECFVFETTVFSLQRNFGGKSSPAGFPTTAKSSVVIRLTFVCYLHEKLLAFHR